ncbi:CocE/NonD family hydrolase [Halobacteriovorax sp. DA5]|uniref:CocE/NonD family hydrolase n=1 Tax=Halobacteriovorax sp. DA5 TaxID=2067553 RepID=UPI000CD328C3|nr:CocE/NonD family hydrolase [Halobacteriovorax sp. DA5]POB14392.1 hypothetical protein C0Z22_04680 [Halobacteriovorax sp. DA5]
MYRYLIILFVVFLTTSQVHALTKIRSMEQLCLDLKTFTKSELIKNKKISIHEDSKVDFLYSNYVDYCGKIRKVLDIDHYKIYQNIDDGRVIEFIIDREGTIRIYKYEYPIVQIHARQLMPKNGDVILPTFIFRPLDIPFSVKRDAILNQTPYSFHGKSIIDDIYQKNEVLIRNYDFITSVARGTLFGNKGFDWLDWKQTREDSRAIINEIVKNDWHSGNIILEGGSYDGYMALAAATTYHPAIKLVVAGSSPTSPFEHSLTNGGLYHKGLNYELSYKSKSFRHFDALNSLETNHYKGSDSTTKKLADYYNLFRSDFTNVQANKFYDNVMATQNHIVSDFAQSNNDDFYLALRKVDIPIVLEFGVEDDQDSKDSLDLYGHLKDMDNVKLMSHNLGHATQALMFGFLTLANEGQTEFNFENHVNVFNGLSSYNFLFYQDSINFVKIEDDSYNSFVSKNYPKNLTLSVSDGIASAENEYVFGTFKIRFKVTGVTKPIFVKSTLKINNKWIVQNILVKKIDKDGVYEVETQHFGGALSGKITPYFSLEKMKEGDPSIDNIKVQAIDVSINAMN